MVRLVRIESVLQPSAVVVFLIQYGEIGTLLALLILEFSFRFLIQYGEIGTSSSKRVLDVRPLFLIQYGEIGTYAAFTAFRLTLCF